MLARYKMYRGPRPVDDPMPDGLRQDTRWRTRHVLRPTQEIVERYLAAPTDAAWRRFRIGYLALLAARFEETRQPFDDLAADAAKRNVFLGCSCPTQANPRVDRCHTVLALRFMKRKYPKLRVVMPSP